ETDRHHSHSLAHVRARRLRTVARDGRMAWWRRGACWREKRERNSMSAGPFRVLSLDGGGIRGAYAAAFLASVEEMSGKTLVDYFDLIVGTSTGGIIAAALGLGLSAKRVLDFYEQHGPAIFPSASKIDRVLARMRRFSRPKFSAAGLEKALKEVFDGRLLGESRCRLVIPAYEVVS